MYLTVLLLLLIVLIGLYTLLKHVIQEDNISSLFITFQKIMLNIFLIIEMWFTENEF